MFCGPNYIVVKSFILNVIFFEQYLAIFRAGLISKLTMLLVNISLKFQMLMSQIRQYFLLKKSEKLLLGSFFFSTKNINIFDYRKRLNKLTS